MVYTTPRTTRLLTITKLKNTQPLKADVWPTIHGTGSTMTFLNDTESVVNSE